MKIVFMGTPDFAAEALDALCRAGHEILLVVTQPDRPKGRGQTLVPCAAKETALKYGLKVFQPERIKRPEAVEELKKYPADVYVVAAFGQILSQEILDLPRLGCLNIHGSLLPKYRGAAPIQWAVINGDKVTGITIMQMNAGMDTGDILMQRELPISEEDTGASLFDRMTELGGSLIVEALEKLEAGLLTPVKQDEDKASYASMLKKEMGRIDWKRSASELACLIRGLNSWPGAYSMSGGRTYKLHMAHEAGREEAREIGRKGARPGEVVLSGGDALYVACGEGILAITEIQPEGKKRMNAHDFSLGYHIKEFES